MPVYTLGTSFKILGATFLFAFQPSSLQLLNEANETRARGYNARYIQESASLDSNYTISVFSSFFARVLGVHITRRWFFDFFLPFLYSTSFHAIHSRVFFFLLFSFIFFHERGEKVCVALWRLQFC